MFVFVIIIFFVASNKQDKYTNRLTVAVYVRFYEIFAWLTKKKSFIGSMVC